MKQDVKEARQVLDFVLLNNFESFLQMCFLYLNPGVRFLPNWHIKAIAHQLDRVRDPGARTQKLGTPVKTNRDTAKHTGSLREKDW